MLRYSIFVFFILFYLIFENIFSYLIFLFHENMYLKDILQQNTRTLLYYYYFCKVVDIHAEKFAHLVLKNVVTNVNIQNVQKNVVCHVFHVW